MCSDLQLGCVKYCGHECLVRLTDTPGTNSCNLDRFKIPVKVSRLV